MVITVRGIRRSEGVIPESKTTYAGWKLFFTYKAFDPEIVGEDVGDRFISDKLLGGIVPNIGDKLELFVNFDGKIVKVTHVIENKGNNLNPNAK